MLDSDEYVSLILDEMEKQLPGTQRSNIGVGSLVAIVQKHHQPTEEFTHGIVARLLTKSATHPHGIKVALETGKVGRVKTVYLDGAPST